MHEASEVDQMVDALIEREGGYVNHPADKGGPTCFGITEAVARAHGYAGPMRQLPRDGSGGDLPAALLAAAALRRGRAAQRARRGRAVRHRRQHGSGGRSDLPPARADRAQPQRQRLSRPRARRPHRRPKTLAALDAFLAKRGTKSGETVLLRALEALQGERYLRLAERRPANEAFLYGWLANRIGER